MKIWLKAGPEEGRVVQGLGAQYDKCAKAWYFMAKRLTDPHPVSRWIDRDIPSNQRKLDTAATLAAQKAAAPRSIRSARNKAEKGQLKKKKADAERAAAAKIVN
jgi:hypothetical protein